MHVDLYCINQNKEPIMFVLEPSSSIGYNACAWSETGEISVMRLLFDSHHEWLINLTGKTAVHIISKLGSGIERHSYKFVRLVVS